MVIEGFCVWNEACFAILAIYRACRTFGAVAKNETKLLRKSNVYGEKKDAEKFAVKMI